MSFLVIFCLCLNVPISSPEPVEQVLPRQRAEGDDQAGCAENVSIAVLLAPFVALTPQFNVSCFLIFLTRFPEIRYFQDEDVRTKLTDILFCYARENEQLLYKQVVGALIGLGFFPPLSCSVAYVRAPQTNANAFL